MLNIKQVLTRKVVQVLVPIVLFVAIELVTSVLDVPTKVWYIYIFPYCRIGNHVSIYTIRSCDDACELQSGGKCVMRTILWT